MPDNVCWYADFIKCERTWLPAKTEIRHMESAAQRIVVDAFANRLSVGVNDLVKHPKRKIPRYPLLR